MAKTTEDACFMYRKAINRVDEKDKMNVVSKEEIYQRLQVYRINTIGAFHEDFTRDEVRQALTQLGNNGAEVSRSVREFKSRA